MAYSDIQEKLGQQRMANSVLLAEKYSQGNLFPKGSDERPYSKNPRAEGARKKREYKKAKEVSDNARKREWKARKDRGEVFGDMPPDFNLIETGGKVLDLLKFVPQMMIRGNRIAGVPDFPGGGYGTTSGALVDRNGEAYFLIDGELIPQGGYDPAKHGDIIPHGGPDIPQAMKNQDMMIAQGPELGGTGRLLTIGEYNQAVDRGFNNLMGSDMTPQDFEDYLEIKKTARRQMLDGV